MDNLLTLSMIVKNEEQFLPQCLASVKDIVDDMVIVDTGSTDHTMEIAHDFGARVIQIDWPNDFARARNVGLDAVKTPWILVMDADEELVAEDIPVLKNAIQKPTADAYNVRIVSVMERAEDISESYVTRIFRSHPDVRFEGAIHEQVFYSLARAKQSLVSLNLRLIHKGYLSSVFNARNKADRNLELLELHVAKNPEDGYMLWQLGQSYVGAGQYDKALAAINRSLKRLPLDNPIRVLALMTQARALFHAKMPKKALRVLEQSLALYPAYTDFRYLEGTILMDLEQWDKAHEAFQDCLKLGEPQGFLMTETGVGGFKALFRLAQVALAQKDSKQALAYLLMAIRTQPNYRHAWQSVASLMMGAPIAQLFQTLSLAIPRDTIIASLKSWPSRNVDEQHLLEYAEQYGATPQS
ncbi:MAG: glycosyl transferase family 2 [Sulfobacillus benefaciens]|uniref:Glycosyl transferase family 2 n=1 Tax=Sulfobacillus benefaciens TaxID=453960 RepID=A0A2T2X723_9FIRM|nr:MAG: glycosyl transferase family 2 [Sulfobacillus benefaciens]